MWFEVFVEFCESLLPTIQDTALDIMNFLAFEFTFPGIDLGFAVIEETTISVGTLLFGSSLTFGLTLSIWAFILKLIPIA